VDTVVAEVDGRAIRAADQRFTLKQDVGIGQGDDSGKQGRAERQLSPKVNLPGRAWAGLAGWHGLVDWIGHTRAGRASNGDGVGRPDQPDAMLPSRTRSNPAVKGHAGRDRDRSHRQRAKRLEIDPQMKARLIMRVVSFAIIPIPTAANIPTTDPNRVRRHVSDTVVPFESRRFRSPRSARTDGSSQPAGCLTDDTAHSLPGG